MNVNWTTSSRHSRFSQNNEGSFLTRLCAELGILEGGYKRNALDLGAGDGFKLSNVRHFLEDFGWSLHLFDYNDAPNVHKEFITRENVVSILDKHGVPNEIDVMSLDLDGNDYWIWKAFFDGQTRRPKVVITEYNLNLNPNVSKTIVYNETHRFQDNDYYGASRLAFERLFDHNGYSVVGYMGDNMFFVRKDYLTDELKAKIPATKTLAPRQVWKPSKRTDWVENPPV